MYKQRAGIEVFRTGGIYIPKVYIDSSRSRCDARKFGYTQTGDEAWINEMPPDGRARQRRETREKKRRVTVHSLWQSGRHILPLPLAFTRSHIHTAIDFYFTNFFVPRAECMRNKLITAGKCVYAYVRMPEIWYINIEPALGFVL